VLRRFFIHTSCEGAHYVRDVLRRLLSLRPQQFVGSRA
jgi:hypothetical protein